MPDVPPDDYWGMDRLDNRQLDRIDNDHDLLVETHALVKTLNTKLLGNGQPGLLHDVAGLRAEVNLLKTQVPSSFDRKTATGTMAGVVALFIGIISERLGIKLPL